MIELTSCNTDYYYYREERSCRNNLESVQEKPVSPDFEFAVYQYEHMMCVCVCV